MPAHTLRTIETFLAQKRLAFVGLSRDAKDFSRMLLAELETRGYDVVPVNPNATEVAGKRCFPSVSAIQPPVEAALLLTTALATDDVVIDCAAAGVRYIWMYRAVGRGAVSEAAVAFCRAKGIEVVAGECPFMYLPHTQWFHRLHGGFRKVTGTFPLAG